MPDGRWQLTLKNTPVGDPVPICSETCYVSGIDSRRKGSAKTKKQLQENVGVI